ncbi:peptide deformylase [Arthrobacter sp. 7Tela_A1]|uniref:peptide deformylase n=1 Tax=Arthrobacter sp. 7Tela_A1 TaxID=3093745 RepID=UPI003BB7C521
MIYEPSAAESSAAIRELVLPMLESELVPIVQLGHPALRRPAVPFDGQLNDDELAALIALMRRVMHDAPGVGLAAPQIGIPLRIAVLEDNYVPEPEAAELRERSPLPFFTIMNPRYEPLDDQTAAFYEGCLSFEGYQGVVVRHRSVGLDYDDEAGTARRREFHGWSARIVQHETDHLNGIVYVDKALTRSLSSNSEFMRWAAPGIDDARRILGF